jgi:uncharacterized membrane protein YdjX (TVP38/TMEM64 family)
MKRSIVLGATAGLVFAAYVLAVPVLGLSDVIIGYVDRLYLARAEIIVQYYLLLHLIYFGACAVTVALCLPLAALMAVMGGLFFGIAGVATALLGVTLGSIAPFLASRRFAGPALAKINAELVERFRRGFERNQFQYLILMRLIPWAPFTVTTIIAGALGMTLGRFLIGTAVGFVPAGLAFNAIGQGLGRLSDLRNISAVDLLSDTDFLVAAVGVIAVTLLTLVRRFSSVTRLFG